MGCKLKYNYDNELIVKCFDIVSLMLCWFDSRDESILRDINKEKISIDSWTRTHNYIPEIIDLKVNVINSIIKEINVPEIKITDDDEVFLSLINAIKKYASEIIVINFYDGLPTITFGLGNIEIIYNFLNDLEDIFNMDKERIKLALLQDLSYMLENTEIDLGTTVNTMYQIFAENQNKKLSSLK